MEIVPHWFWSLLIPPLLSCTVLLIVLAMRPDRSVRIGAFAFVAVCALIGALNAWGELRGERRNAMYAECVANNDGKDCKWKPSAGVFVPVSLRYSEQNK